MIGNKQNIVCYGEILWDNLPGGRVPGGAPMNVAVQCSNLGLDPILISRVGNDDDGAALLGFLKAQGISVSCIQSDKHLPTGYVDVVLGKDEEVAYIIAHPAAWDNIEVDDWLVELTGKADVFVYGSLACRSERSRATLFELLKHARKKVFDLNFRPPHYSLDLLDRLLNMSDIIKLNMDEFKELLEYAGKSDMKDKEAMEWLRTHYALEAVIITRGSKGAWLNKYGFFISHPGYVVDVVDPVGSGDAFLAAYLTTDMMGYAPSDQLAFSCAAGAIVASHSGAVPQLSLDLIVDLIERSP